MDRITKKDMESITDRVTMEAKAAGLLAEGERVVYGAGNPSNGIAAVLEVRTEDYKYRAADWLPRFSYKDNKRTQWRMLGAVADTLYGINTRNR